MDKILSQDEINALFSAMSSEDPKLSTPADKGLVTGRVTSYDFRRADRISQDQMRSLHLLHDFFAKNLTASLSAYLRAFVGVNLISVDQVSYAEFLKLLPDPTLFSSIAMRPLAGNAALELNPSVAFPMIDMLLGGPGNPPPSERSLTEIEINIIEGVIRLALRDLKEAWRPVMEIDFCLESSETKHQSFQIVSPSEAVVSMGFEIKVGENAGMMNVCIPSRMLKTIRNKFDQQWHVRRETAAASQSKRIGEILQTAAIELTGEIHDNCITAGDLVRIGAGDVVQLNHRLGDSLVVSVAGIPKFRGRLTLLRGNKAIEITQRIED